MIKYLCGVVLVFISLETSSQELDSILYSRYVPDSCIRVKDYKNAYFYYNQHIDRYCDFTGQFTFFNAACVASSLGHLRMASTYLRNAMDLGFDDTLLYNNDKDLVALRLSDYGIGIEKYLLEQINRRNSMEYKFIDSILKVLISFDQIVRTQMIGINYSDSAQLLKHLIDINNIDLLNQQFISILFNKINNSKFVYTSMVYRNLFLLIQHNKNLQILESYLPFMQNWTLKEFMPASNLALLIDRIEIYNNREQIYGTQTYFEYKTGKTTLCKIKNKDGVNFKRKLMQLKPLSLY